MNPIDQSFDVLVAGGGPAGVCAALVGTLKGQGVFLG